MSDGIGKSQASMNKSRSPVTEEAILKALEGPWEKPSDAALAAARALGAPKPAGRTYVFPLWTFTKAALAVRSSAGELHAEASAEGCALRMMAASDGKGGWDLIGQVEGQVEALEIGGQPQPLAEGRFECSVSALGSQEIEIVAQGVTIVGPTLAEFFGNGSV